MFWSTLGPVDVDSARLRIDSYCGKGLLGQDATAGHWRWNHTTISVSLATRTRRHLLTDIAYVEVDRLLDLHIHVSEMTESFTALWLDRRRWNRGLAKIYCKAHSKSFSPVYKHIFSRFLF